MAKSDLVLAMTGASGSAYGLRLLEMCLDAGRTVHFIASEAAIEVFRTEQGRDIPVRAFSLEDLFGRPVPQDWGARWRRHDLRDFKAGVASGSFLTAGMAICPCSMGTVGAIAHGISQNLIHRAADVHLKERRKLLLVPRETPLGVVQLRNLTACAEAGAIVLPAMPAFYTKPESVQDMVDFIVARICDQLDVPHRLLRRWGEP